MKDFAVTSSTEWALETTEETLTDDTLAWLRGRFSRLHVGIQTLEEPLRGRIGRRLTVGESLRRLRNVLSMDFVTSCDVMYDLPGQTMKSYLRSLAKLVDTGIHGVSCYRFNRTSRNRSMRCRLDDPGRNAARQLAMFSAAELLLLDRGFTKNHFAHFAKPQDRNLYFTYPIRNEDLVAFGAWADGRIGLCEYRHSNKFRVAEASGQLYGRLLSAEEAAFKDVVAMFMCCRIHKSKLSSWLHRELIEQWKQIGLIDPLSEHDLWTLSSLGSWHLSRMLANLCSTG